MVIHTNKQGDELHVNWDHEDIGIEWFEKKPDGSFTGDLSIRIPKGAHEALLEYILNGPHKGKVVP